MGEPAAVPLVSEEGGSGSTALGDQERKDRVREWRDMSLGTGGDQGGAQAEESQEGGYGQ